MIRKLVRGIITVVFGATGFFLSLVILSGDNPIFDFSPLVNDKYAFVIASTLIPTLLGFLISPWLITQTIQLTGWFEGRLQRMPTQELIGGAVGLIIGLIIANLLVSSVSSIPYVGKILPVILSLFFGYLGLSLGAKKKEEVLSIFPRFSSREKAPKLDRKTQYKLLDTSVIIDGRIADICKSGFIEGTLMIPGFILEELQHIADSSDALKRNRGRRGLDILNKIRKELDVMVQIYHRDYEDIAEVDSKLVRLAQEVGGMVVTNDYNLNKVAELQGVRVLNINELANAIKPVVLPGEEMVVQIIKDGKEPGQGVAYLDDGTMIVVDGGKKFMGQTITVLVTSVLQTAAGRMIFAKPKAQERTNEKKEKAANGQPVLNEVNAIV